MLQNVVTVIVSTMKGIPLLIKKTRMRKALSRCLLIKAALQEKWLLTRTHRWVKEATSLLTNMLRLGQDNVLSSTIPKVENLQLSLQIY